MNQFRALCVGALLACMSLAIGYSQEGSNVPRPTSLPVETEPGIPVVDKLTAQKCGTCHKADDKGNLTRISWIRTTPEGWQEAIKRMVRLNGLVLQPDEARHILNYLTTDHGLAPEETQPHRWYLEMRQINEEQLPSPQVRIACASCHPFARPQTWHRSPAEWKLLVNMHLGYFPVSEYNSFHARARPDGYGVLPATLTTPVTPGPAPGAGPVPNPKEPVDEALEYLEKNQGLHAAAWSNWRAALQDPNLKGRWIISGSSPGKGRYYGTMTVTPGNAPSAFKTETTLTRVADGSTMTFSGETFIYTGYEWRGRSQCKPIGTVREVMTISADQSKIEGRWFWGGYQEFELNVMARRASNDITVVGTDVSSIQQGAKAVSIKIIGENFRRGLTAADINLGVGVRVTKVTSVKPTEIGIVVDVDPKIISGFRTVSVKARTAPSALAVYDKIDYIRVVSSSALARLGGAGHPKGYVQYEAVAFNRGLDGIANTSDDIDLGPIPVRWSMEEFIARYNDDDKEFVGSISADGLFTPAAEGPNPQRRFSTNNTGDVWVVATYKTGRNVPSDKEAEALTAKSYLAVTVPVYMKWDQPEVAQ